MMPKCFGNRWCGSLVLAALLLPGLAPAQGSGGDWRYGADLRAGFFASERDRRDGGEQSDESLRARLRFYLQRELSPSWLFRTRLAGSFSSEDNDFALRLDRYRATPTGTRAGEVHFDEFYARWQDANNRHQLRIGRFQTAFNLPVVPGKSLDRNDASNVGIGWTDGLYWQSQLESGWEWHAIAQANHPLGASNTARRPLDFSDDGSRLGAYLALRSTEPFGPLSLRMLSLNWVPDSLAVNGLSDPRREDYLTVTAKAAAGWPMSEDGRRFVLAGEYGRALETPQRPALGLVGSGRTAGDAYQISANIFDLAPGHHVGLVVGRAHAGWLTSNDYRNNDDLYEIRYQRRFTPDLSIEVRFRIRQEIERRIGAERLQHDRDLYARVTWRIR
ncbi:MAG: hypothetical protein HND55_10980 [Pseudomonadota bacterium]|nr:MAG: hypothetical protein HND55_10980 [Pseudomonadota bacterium]